MSAKESIQARQNRLEEDLRQLQRQIYEAEENLIAESSHYGNIVKGWEGFLATTDIKPLHSSRKSKVVDKDRVFSMSSVTFDYDTLDLDGDDYMDDQQKKTKGRKYYDEYE